MLRWKIPYNLGLISPKLYLNLTSFFEKYSDLQSTFVIYTASAQIISSQRTTGYRVHHHPIFSLNHHIRNDKPIVIHFEQGKKIHLTNKKPSVSIRSETSDRNKPPGFVDDINAQSMCKKTLHFLFQHAQEIGSYLQAFVAFHLGLKIQNLS